MSYSMNPNSNLLAYLKHMNLNVGESTTSIIAHPLENFESTFCKEEYLPEQENTIINKNALHNPKTYNLHQSSAVSSDTIKVENQTNQFFNVKQEAENFVALSTSAEGSPGFKGLSSQSKKIKKETSPRKEKNPPRAPRKKKAYWTEEEDAQLIKLLDEMGPKWTRIGRIIGDRSGKQVRDRYLHNLKPDISFEKWTEDEDALVMLLYNKYGNKWLQIAEHLPNRTDNQVKNRFYSRIIYQMPENAPEIELKQEVKCETGVKLE